MASPLIPGLVIAALFVGANIMLHARQERLARRRVGEGFSDFAASFVNKGVPPEVLVNTYNYFGEWSRVAGELFPVRPADNISDVYGCVDEDLEDAVGEILKKSGRRWSTRVELRQQARLETVEDLVLYVAAAPVLPVKDRI